MGMFLIHLLEALCASRVISRLPQDRALEESAIGSAKDAPSGATSAQAKSIFCQTQISSTIAKSKLLQHFRTMLELGRTVKLVV
jgi:hypothetical protein